MLLMSAERIPAEQIDMAHQMALYADVFETEYIATRAQEEELGAALDDFRTQHPIPDYIDHAYLHPGQEDLAIEDRDSELWTAWHGFKAWRNGLRAAAYLRASTAELDYAAGVDYSEMVAVNDARHLDRVREYAGDGWTSPGRGAYGELAAAYGPLTAYEMEGDALQTL
jgi:hypothetical protein